MVLNDDSLALAVLVKTYSLVLLIAEFSGVQSLGVVDVTEPAMMATRKLPAVAAVNVQV